MIITPNINNLENLIGKNYRVDISSVNSKVEWLRYGTDWKKLESNISQLTEISNYKEAHCILSVLNIGDLPNLKNFCDQNKINLKISALYQPWFMSLENWDKDPAQLVNRNFLKLMDGKRRGFL